MSARLLRGPLVVLLLVALVAGCKVDSVNPVTPLAGSAPDTALYGVWRYRDKGERTFVHVGPEFSLAADANRPQRIRIVIVDHKQNGLTDEAYVAHASRVGNERYLNVLQEESGKPAGFIVVRYRLAGKNAVRFATIDGEKLKAAIAGGRITGTTLGDKISSETAMTASSADVEAFLRAEGSRLFAREFELERVR